jgi:hypothetical protein
LYKKLAYTVKRFCRGGILPLVFTGIVLIGAGTFLILQSITGYFLPHDASSIGYTAEELSRYYNGRIVNFIFHDRVAYGGSIISVGIIYAWLALYPLKEGRKWAWLVFLLSGIYGFGSFFTYIGHGYFDYWHAIATLLLFGLYAVGMYYSISVLKNKQGLQPVTSFLTAFKEETLPERVGLALLLFTAAGLFLAGTTIMYIGMTAVFVPEDLAYMSITTCGLNTVSSQLIPVIAHDRAAFGGGLATIGLMLLFILVQVQYTFTLWKMLLLALSIVYSCYCSTPPDWLYRFLASGTGLCRLYPVSSSYVIDL